MAKYIKQEMADIHGTGENKCFYRLQTTRQYCIVKTLTLNPALY